MNRVKIVSIIMLIIIAIIFTCILLVKSESVNDHGSNFKRYLNTKSQSYISKNVMCFSFKMPEEWDNNKKLESDIIEEMKAFYAAHANDSSSYNYSDCIIFDQDQYFFQLIQKDKIYLNIKVTDGSSLPKESDIDSFIEEKEYDMNGSRIGKLLQSDSNRIIYRIYNNRFDGSYSSDPCTGYLTLCLSKKESKIAILSIMVSDEIFNNFPGLDRILAEGLKEE